MKRKKMVLTIRNEYELSFMPWNTNNRTVVEVKSKLYFNSIRILHTTSDCCLVNSKYD